MKSTAAGSMFLARASAMDSRTAAFSVDPSKTMSEAGTSPASESGMPTTQAPSIPLIASNRCSISAHEMLFPFLTMICFFLPVTCMSFSSSI